MSTHAIELVQADEPECGDDGTVLIGANPNLGEKLAYEVLMRGLLEDEIRFGAALDEKLLGVHDDENKKSNRPKKKRKSTSKGDNTNNSATTMDTAEKSNHNQVLLKRQQTYNDSRIDVELRQNDKRCLIEIKNVVCADYCKDTAPSKKGKNHCVVVSDASASLDEDAEYSYQRSGLFPWGKKTQQFEDQKVVSARAIKHVRNLVDLHLTSAAKEQEVESSSSNSNLKNNDGTLVTSCMVLFVLNRADCLSMRACHEGCGVFATELKKAADAGVLVRSFRVKWTTEGLAYFDGIVPVDFSKTIT
uniref:Sugar fermentation stimulation protein C-terminal domain-containing protein n=1 Tax=Leptocylindrus danicus TaxID=163516 RepID=A0A7S2K3A8_9STRA